MSPRCFSILACSCLFANLCPAKPKNSQTVPNPEALELGRTFLRQLGTDVDLQAKSGLRLVEWLLAHHQAEKAQAVAMSLGDYRREVSLAKIAAAHAQEAKTKQAVALFKQVEDKLGKYQLASQSEEVAIATVIAYLALKKPEAAEPARQIITTENARQRLQVLELQEKAREGKWDEATLKALAEIDTPSKQNAADVIADTLLMVAQLCWEKKEEEAAKKWSSLAMEAIGKGGDIRQISHLRDACRLHLRHGDTEGATALFKRCVQQARSLAKLADWKSMELSRCGILAHEMGQSELATALAFEAEASALPQQAMDQPAAFVEAAACFQALGRDADAARCQQKALEIARANPNKRMGALAGFETCMTYLDLGLALPAAELSAWKKLATDLATPAL